jgi:Co/Zn/Cd efflux system component
MKRPAPFVAGIVIALLGILFTLQGVGVISGSTMSNTTTWSVLGPIIAIVGVLLVIRGTRPLATTAQSNDEGGL